MNEPRRGPGEVMGSTAGSIFGFAGEQTDATGLQYLRARYYAPEQGRFLTVDPFTGMPATPATLHPYMYGLNNPLIYVDPSGQCYGIFDWIRDYEPVGCGNLDLANSIVFNSNSTIEQRLGAATYQVGFVGSHVGLAGGLGAAAYGISPMLGGAYFGSGMDFLAQMGTNGGELECLYLDQIVVSGLVGGIGAQLSGYVSNAPYISTSVGSGVNPENVHSAMRAILANTGLSGVVGSVGTIGLNLWRENNPGQGLLKSFFISSLAGGVGSIAEELVVDVGKIIASNMDTNSMGSSILERLNFLDKIEKVLGVFARIGTGLAYPTSNSGPLMELEMPWLNSLEPYLGVLWESPSAPDNCQCQCDTTEEPISELTEEPALDSPFFDDPSLNWVEPPSIHHNYDEPEPPFCSF